MMKLRALFCSFILLSLPAHAFETKAKQAYMIDAVTGEVLFSKNADEAMTPSSMSKMMTTYLVFERLKKGDLALEDTFTVSEKAWAKQGSKMYVELGGQVSVDELLHGIIVQSGNDACIVVAEGMAGSEEAFAELMNQKAKEMGLTQSHFVNATGWPDEGHVMSAKDVAILSLRLIQDFPEYYPLFAVKEYEYNHILQYNRNRLLHDVIGVDGLKTGHTEAGGYGIAASAKQGDRRLIAVVNGLENDYERLSAAFQMLEWGFAAFTNKTLIPAGKVVAQGDVWFGVKDTVPLMVENDVIVTLPAETEADIKYELTYAAPIPAAITKGTHVADLTITAGDMIHTVPLVAGEDISKVSGVNKMLAVMKHYLTGIMK